MRSAALDADGMETAAARIAAAASEVEAIAEYFIVVPPVVTDRMARS